MLATPGALPVGPGWMFEVEWEGLRLLADGLDRRRATLLTRSTSPAARSAACRQGRGLPGILVKRRAPVYRCGVRRADRQHAEQVDMAVDKVKGILPGDQVDEDGEAAPEPLPA